MRLNSSPDKRCPAAAVALLAGVTLVGAAAPAALAQAGSYLWGPGSNVGPSTRVVPQNCVTAKDGSITCDTKVVNPPGDTPAKPQYDPFKN